MMKRKYYVVTWKIKDNYSAISTADVYKLTYNSYIDLFNQMKVICKKQKSYCRFYIMKNNHLVCVAAIDRYISNKSNY